MKFLYTIILFLLCFTLVGCENNRLNADVNIQKPSQSTSTQLNQNSNKTLYIYNSKGENAEKLKQLLDAYSIIAAVNVKVVSSEPGKDSMELLRTEMNSEHPPAIFSIQGIKELEEWTQKESVLDLNQITNERFKTLVTSIDKGLWLTLDGVKSYGIPYNVEGYGYIVDKAMLGDLFGTDNIDKIVNDLQKCSYEEWEVFVKSVDNYIKTSYSDDIVLNNNPYKFNTQKTGLANNLTGVFAVMGAEKWTYGDHFVNIALNATFSNPSEAYKADSTKIDSLNNIFMMYAKALDFKTSYIAGANGKVYRSKDFISPDLYGYNQTMELFAESKAVFFKQGNWAYGSIAEKNANMAKRLTFVPVKMPITQDLISVDGLTVKKFNSSIPVFVPNYYAINAKVNADEQKLAVDFLLWLNTSPAGQKYLSDSFEFIPYNADPETTTLNNSLGNSILKYMAEENTLSAPYYGTPGDWPSNVFGLKIMQSYMTKQTWTEEDYNSIAQFAISSWKSLK